MLNFSRQVKGSTCLFVLSLLLVACASVAGRDEFGSISPEPVDERTPAQTLQETTGMMGTPTAARSRRLAVDIPDLGLAPDIANEMWINTPGPVTLKGLRGRVVLLEFWTYG